MSNDPEDYKSALAGAVKHVVELNRDLKRAVALGETYVTRCRELERALAEKEGRVSEPEKCPVCGDELDFYGCLGELRGRHLVVERQRLDKRVKGLEEDLGIALDVARKNGLRVEELEAQRARLRGQLEALAKKWDDDASRRGPGVLRMCAEELRALVKP